jgi:pyruvate,water dikinase
MSQLDFKAPDDGVWEQDGAHCPRPMTRLFQEAFPEGFMKGFRNGTDCYGLMLSHLEPGFVNGFCYHKAVIVGAPKNARGLPPKAVFKLMSLLHPKIRRRLKTAATILEQKPWRDHIRHWDSVLKPRATGNHLRLQSRDPAAMTDAELSGYIKECYENLKEMVYQHHIYTISCGVPVGDFMARAQAWTKLPPSEIAQALRGSTPISAGVTDEYLSALAAISFDKDAVALLHGATPPAEILKQLRKLPAVKAYLDLVSYRVAGGYDISCPVAIETPEAIVGALRAKYSPEDAAEDARKVREHVAKLRAAVPEQHRTHFDELLKDARLVNRLRDERSYWSDLWAAGIVRRALLEAGARLAAKGKIKAADHILDATCPEIVALLDPQAASPAPAAGELEARYQYRVSVAADAAPPVLNGPSGGPPPIDWFPPAARRTMEAMAVFMSHLFKPTEKKSEGKTVRGIPVSAGKYEGRARVISSIDGLSQLQKGEVLVTRSTSTSFNHILPLIGAVVTDRGGLMSHAAIVAREYGLPGIVGCQVATQVIPDGAMVRVDADAGEITILS